MVEVVGWRWQWRPVTCTRSLAPSVPAPSTVTDSTIADLIASPVGSWQTNDGPRSTKTAPHSPRTSVRMKAIGGDAARHAASTASARSSGASTATTTWYCARPSIGKAPASAPTFTPGLSSCICRAHASARFFPSSAGVR